jgi:hypothetical protein
MLRFFDECFDLLFKAVYINVLIIASEAFNVEFLRVLTTWPVL